ncbi:MAG: hypothetical protein R3F45_03860 [Gammaproteobacteria bacterium]
MVSNRELGQLCADYEALFHETAPLLMLPEDEDEAARLLRQMIEERDNSMLERLIPDAATS